MRRRDRTVGSPESVLPPYVVPYREGCCLRVHVQPRAKTTAWAGVYGDRLKLRIAAPPADGAANAACIRALAERLSVPRAAITLVRGAAARDKDFAITGLPGEAAAAVLAAGK